MLYVISLIILGVVAGMLSGLIGIGGGIIIVPALVFLYGFSQQMAQGTTLALLVPPIGILAAYAYYQKGMVDIKIAVIVCLGFIIGSLLGAKFAIRLPTQILSKVFAGFLIVIALKMLTTR